MVHGRTPGRLFGDVYRDKAVMEQAAVIGAAPEHISAGFIECGRHLVNAVFRDRRWHKQSAPGRISTGAGVFPDFHLGWVEADFARAAILVPGKVQAVDLVHSHLHGWAGHALFHDEFGGDEGAGQRPAGEFGETARFLYRVTRLGQAVIGNQGVEHDGFADRNGADIVALDSDHRRHIGPGLRAARAGAEGTGLGGNHHVVDEIVIAQGCIGLLLDAVDREGPDEFAVAPVRRNRHFEGEAVAPWQKCPGWPRSGSPGSK